MGTMKSCEKMAGEFNSQRCIKSCANRIHLNLSFLVLAFNEFRKNSEWSVVRTQQSPFVAERGSGH